jgi:hypothetical protein
MIGLLSSGCCWSDDESGGCRHYYLYRYSQVSPRSSLIFEHHTVSAWIVSL